MNVGDVLYMRLMSLKPFFRILLALLLLMLAYSWWRAGFGYILTIIIPLFIGPVTFFPALRLGVNAYRNGNLPLLILSGLLMFVCVFIGSLGAITASWFVALNDATMACTVGNRGFYSYEECRGIVLGIMNRKGLFWPLYR